MDIVINNIVLRSRQHCEISNYAQRLLVGYIKNVSELKTIIMEATVVDHMAMAHMFHYVNRHCATAELAKAIEEWNSMEYDNYHRARVEDYQKWLDAYRNKFVHWLEWLERELFKAREGALSLRTEAVRALQCELNAEVFTKRDLGVFHDVVDEKKAVAYDYRRILMRVVHEAAHAHHIAAKSQQQPQAVA